MAVCTSTKVGVACSNTYGDLNALEVAVYGFYMTCCEGDVSSTDMNMIVGDHVAELFWLVPTIRAG